MALPHAHLQYFGEATVHSAAQKHLWCTWPSHHQIWTRWWARVWLQIFFIPLAEVVVLALWTIWLEEYLKYWAIIFSLPGDWVPYVSTAISGNPASIGPPHVVDFAPPAACSQPTTQTLGGLFQSHGRNLCLCASGQPKIIWSGWQWYFGRKIQRNTVFELKQTDPLRQLASHPASDK